MLLLTCTIPYRTAPDLRCKWSDDKQFAGEKRRVRVRVGTGFAPQTIVHRAWKYYISSVVRRVRKRAIATKKEARRRQGQSNKEKTREKEPIVTCQSEMQSAVIFNSSYEDHSLSALKPAFPYWADTSPSITYGTFPSLRCSAFCSRPQQPQLFLHFHFHLHPASSSIYFTLVPPGMQTSL